jgi:hypothetical protein
MNFIFAITHHTGVRLAEVGFLLLAIGGIWLVASDIPALKLDKFRFIVAGLAIAAAGVLLVVATHWGHFS